MTEAPARILGLDAGRLAKGAPADLVLFDPDAPWKVTEEPQEPVQEHAFEGRLVEGRIARTVVDGRTIFLQEAKPPRRLARVGDCARMRPRRGHGER